MRLTDLIDVKQYTDRSDHIMSNYSKLKDKISNFINKSQSI